MSPRFLSTKFLLVLLIQVTACVALFMRIIDGGTYVTLSTLSLSAYGAMSVADKKLNPTQQP